MWTSEWGFSAVFSSYSSTSAGTCKLFNNNFGHKILKQFSDLEGRFVRVDVKTDYKILTLVNVYAPNDDNPTFFKSVLNQLLSFDCEESLEVIITWFWRLKKTNLEETRPLIKTR